MSRNIISANLGMILVTMIWGITFVMVKDALNDAPPFIFLALRKGLAFAAGVIYLNRNIKKITSLEVIGGFLCALALYAGYSFQNFGLIPLQTCVRCNFGPGFFQNFYLFICLWAIN